MRLFFSTGEASGELLAADLLGALRARVPIDAYGIGGTRLEAAGVRIVQRTQGWASVGPLAALRKIPGLWRIMARAALQLRRDPPDGVVLIDFGAFNVRLARTLRLLGFREPIVYYAPPAAWLDNPARAQRVTQYCDALTIFRHQADFYRSLRLPIGYVGHPLVSTIASRVPPPPALPDAGSVALLPGSRAGEIERHTAPLLDAFARLRAHRPHARATLVAADADAERFAQDALAARGPLDVTISRDVRATLERADVAAVASGTAVLEAALIGTPTVALYVLGAAQAKIARRVYRGASITLPNLVLGEPLVPELLQEAATPEALADALDALLSQPGRQLEGYERLRRALGPPDSLARIADWVLHALERPAAEPA